MSAHDGIWKSYERLADALAADLLDAGSEEVEDSHRGRGARVQADAIRQALRRATASRLPDEPLPRELRILAMRPQREDKR